MWLGPAMGPVVRALGATADHQCACGMKRGECGCPICVAEAHESQHPSRHMVIRNRCESDDFVPTFAVAPHAIGATAVATIPVTNTRTREVLSPTPLHDQTANQPPTPPPRRA
jgi:hypothetical protein